MSTQRLKDQWVDAEEPVQVMQPGVVYEYDPVTGETATQETVYPCSEQANKTENTRSDAFEPFMA